MGQNFKLVLVGVLLIMAMGSLIAPAKALNLFSMRIGPGYTGFLRIQPIGEVKSSHRWECAVTVGGSRLYSTGFTETSARAKLTPYTNARFRCQRRFRHVDD